MALTPVKTNLWADRAMSSLNLGMVVAISYLTVKLFFLFVDNGALQSPPTLYGQSSGSKITASMSMAAVDPSAIPLWNLFGREGEVKSQVAIQKEVDAPKTQLQLELQGVFVAGKEENSTAIIAERMREAKLYHIGDKLPGNATLAGVYPDRVLLNTMGRIEALYFPDLSAPGAGNARSSGVNGGGFSPVSNARPDMNSSSMGYGGLAPTGGSRPSFGGPSGMPPANDLAKALKDELGGNPAQALKEMGLEANGGNGYRISGAGNPMLSALGARPGDLVMSINGRPLGNMDSDLANLESFTSEGTLRVEMERNGKRFTTEVPLP